MEASSIRKEDPEHEEMKEALFGDKDLLTKTEQIFGIFENKRNTMWGTFLGFREVKFGISVSDNADIFP